MGCLCAWRACAADDSVLIAVLAVVQKEEMVHSILRINNHLKISGYIISSMGLWFLECTWAASNLVLIAAVTGDVDAVHVQGRSWVCVVHTETSSYYSLL